MKKETFIQKMDEQNQLTFPSSAYTQ
jgi:hypothetical protein